jgi:transposase
VYYVDESGFDEYYARRYGYNKRGQKVLQEVKGIKPSRHSSIAIRGYQHKLKESMIYTGTAGSITVLGFFEHILPNFKAGDTFVFDNAVVHKSKELKELFKKYGCIIKYLPPYSPDLNPIEKLWGSIKRRLRAYYNNSISFLDNLILAINHYSVSG